MCMILKLFNDIAEQKKLQVDKHKSITKKYYYLMIDFEIF